MFHHQFLGKNFDTNYNSVQDSVDSLSDKLDLPVKHANQVHGNNIIVIRTQNQNIIDIQADAIICQLPDVVIGVKTADCIPLLISGINRHGNNIIAAVHLGRKSAILGLATKVIVSLKNDFSFEVEDLTCYIGPHLTQVNHVSFEDEWSQFPAEFVSKMRVGQYVVNNPKLLQNYLDKNKLLTADLSYWQSARINLTGFVIDQLINCGIDSDKIKIDSTDTFDNPNFNSYRRDYPKSGRNFSYIWFDSQK